MDSGLLTYGKNEADIKRGRTQGRINVGTAIISAKTEMFRIDIDDEECIHHLKVILRIIIELIIRQVFQFKLNAKLRFFLSHFLVEQLSRFWILAGATSTT